MFKYSTRLKVYITYGKMGITILKQNPCCYAVNCNFINRYGTSGSA